MTKKVFISYGQDNQERVDAAVSFAQKLRNEGVESRIDQFFTHPDKGWPKWMEEQFRWADVLLICPSPKFRESFYQEGRANGALFEGSLISSKLLENGVSFDKIGICLLYEGDKKYIPDILKPSTYYKIYEDSGYEKIYRWLTEQPALVPLEVGNIVRLHSSNPSFLSNSDKKCQSFEELCKSIKPLLDENGRLFSAFSPNSYDDKSRNLRTDLTIWQNKKISNIVPNNRAIKDLIERSQFLIPSKFQAIFLAWLSHIDAFEMHVEKNGVDYTEHQFPNGVVDIVTKNINNSEENQK